MRTIAIVLKFGIIFDRMNRIYKIEVTGGAKGRSWRGIVSIKKEIVWIMSTVFTEFVSQWQTAGKSQE